MKAVSEHPVTEMLAPAEIRTLEARVSVAYPPDPLVTLTPVAVEVSKARTVIAEFVGIAAIVPVVNVGVMVTGVFADVIDVPRVPP